MRSVRASSGNIPGQVVFVKTGSIQANSGNGQGSILDLSGQQSCCPGSVLATKFLSGICPINKNLVQDLSDCVVGFIWIETFFLNSLEQLGFNST